MSVWVGGCECVGGVCVSVWVCLEGCSKDTWAGCIPLTQTLNERCTFYFMKDIQMKI